MAHDPRKLLFDILDACKNVTEFTAGLSFEQFTSNEAYPIVKTKMSEN